MPGQSAILFGVAGFPGAILVTAFFFLWNWNVGQFFVRPMVDFLREKEYSMLCKAIRSCLIPHVAIGAIVPTIIGGLVGFLVAVIVPCEQRRACRFP